MYAKRGASAPSAATQARAIAGGQRARGGGPGPGGVKAGEGGGARGEQRVAEVCGGLARELGGEDVDSAEQQPRARKVSTRARGARVLVPEEKGLPGVCRAREWLERPAHVARDVHHAQQLALPARPAGGGGGRYGESREEKGGGGGRRAVRTGGRRAGPW